jgi:hypothetical protein
MILCKLFVCDTEDIQKYLKTNKFPETNGKYKKNGCSISIEQSGGNSYFGLLYIRGSDKNKCEALLDEFFYETEAVKLFPNMSSSTAYNKYWIKIYQEMLDYRKWIDYNEWLYSSDGHF